MGRECNATSLFKSFWYIILTALLLLFLPGQSVFGQVDEGSINGVVSDPTGAVVPNAQVTLLNTDQGTTLTTTTSGVGELHFLPGQNRALLHIRLCSRFLHHHSAEFGGDGGTGLAG